MILLISPAKKLDFTEQDLLESKAKPRFLEESGRLIDRLKTLSPEEIGQLMGLSENLSELNRQRYAEWKVKMTGPDTKPAVLAFKGDTYVGLNADTFGAEDFVFAEKHLRILSGLYGLLRPADRIRPYRLEMGTRLATDAGTNLYDFWGNLLSEALKADLKKSGGEPVVINLASDEYFKSIKSRAVGARIIKPVFKDFKNGQYKIISFFAKKARGMMAGFAIRNRITSSEDLKAFDTEGYAFRPEFSSENEWAFYRE